MGPAAPPRRDPGDGGSYCPARPFREAGRCVHRPGQGRGWEWLQLPSTCILHGTLRICPEVCGRRRRPQRVGVQGPPEAEWLGAPKSCRSRWDGCDSTASPRVQPSGVEQASTGASPVVTQPSVHTAELLRVNLAETPAGGSMPWEAAVRDGRSPMKTVGGILVSLLGLSVGLAAGVLVFPWWKPGSRDQLAVGTAETQAKVPDFGSHLPSLCPSQRLGATPAKSGRAGFRPAGPGCQRRIVPSPGVCSRPGGYL